MAKYSSYLPYVKIHAIHTIHTLNSFLIAHIRPSNWHDPEGYKLMWVEIPKINQIQNVGYFNFLASQPKDTWAVCFEKEYKGKIFEQLRTTKDKLMNRYFTMPIEIQDISKKEAIDFLPGLKDIKIHVGQLSSQR